MPGRVEARPAWSKLVRAVAVASRPNGPRAPVVTCARQRTVDIRADRARKLCDIPRDDVVRAERMVSGTRYIASRRPPLRD